MDQKKRNTLWRLLSLYKGYKKDVVIIMIGSVIGVISNLVYPYITKYTVEKVVYMGLKDAIPEIIKVVILLIILLCMDIFQSRIEYYNTSLLYANIIKDIKDALYRKLHRLDASWYDEQHSGKIISIIDGDTDNSSHLVSDIVPLLLSSVIQIIGGIIVFYNISPVMMTWIFPMVIILLIFNIVIIPKMKRQMKSIREIMAVQSEVAEDAIGGIRTTQTYGMEEYEINKFNAISDQLKTAIRNKWKTIFIYYSSSDSISTIIYGTFIILGVILAIQGKAKITDITLFYAYFYIIEQPLIRIRDVSKEISKCMASYERILDIIDTEEGIKEPLVSSIIGQIKGDIEFKNVSFSYKKANELINNISFSIHKGEKVAVVGESGSGKSTIAGLIPRYYDVINGSITIDGVSVKDIALNKLRKSIGFISQDPFLYNISIMDNIRYGLPSATEAQVIEAAKKAGAHEFISMLPNGYNSKVGERGVKLSGGQKQRISIARVFLLNPPIMIFDEATSALDSVQEKKVQEALNKLAEGKTCITIAHRLSTIKNANRIFVMKSGDIIEIGTHEELLTKEGGEYQKLYNTQYKEM